MRQKRVGILYITYDGLCDPLGQSQVIPYVRGLADKGINIVVLSFEKKASLEKIVLIDRLKRELGRNGIRWKYLWYHNRPRALSTLYDCLCGLWNGWFLAKKYGLSIAHARGYVPAFMASWLKKIMKIRFIFDMRGFWVEEKADAGFWSTDSVAYKIAKSIESGLLDAADEIVVLTQKAKLFLLSQARKPERSIVVIPTCVDLKIFKPQKGERMGFLQGKAVILYSGSIGTFYGFREIARFFKILQQKKRDVFFLGLVNNDKEAAEEALRGQGVGEDSYRVLALSYAEVPDWLKGADASVMFYRRYNSHAGCCPTKFAESLACGVPVIINKGIGDCDAILEKEGVGFVLDDFTETAMAKTGERFLATLKDRGSMRLKCRSIAENLFSLEMGVQKYSALY